MSCGVMRIYCLRFDALAVSIYQGTSVKSYTKMNVRKDPTYHHPHTDTTVDSVHENIEFIWSYVSQVHMHHPLKITHRGNE